MKRKRVVLGRGKLYIMSGKSLLGLEDKNSEVLKLKGLKYHGKTVTLIAEVEE